VTRDDALQIPLVEGPIGALVSEIQSEEEDIGVLVDSPGKLLAFRTFAYLRVGLLLGRLLMERDIVPDDSESWAEQLLQDPEVRAQAVAEVRADAEEIAQDPDYAEDGPLGPDEAERRRFLEFAKRRLAADT
jgi:hypothetical protein